MTRPYELLTLLVLLSCGSQSEITPAAAEQRETEWIARNSQTFCIAGHRYALLNRRAAVPLFTPGGAPQRCAEQ